MTPSLGDIENEPAFTAFGDADHDGTGGSDYEGGAITELLVMAAVRGRRYRTALTSSPSRGPDPADWPSF